EGRGGRKDRFGGRGGKSRFEDERSERKFGARPGGKPAAKSGGEHGERSTRRPEERSVGAKRAPAPRARGEGWTEGASRRPEPRREETVRPMQKAEPEISPALAAATKVQTVTVTPDENDMRVDRFFEARFPGLSFSHIQRIVRKGEVRVDGKRTETKSRLEAGQHIRIPPLQLAAPRVREDSPQVLKDCEYLRSITLAEDDDVLVLNKPMGLAVQGGSGTTR